MSTAQTQNASTEATNTYQDTAFKLFIPFLHEKTTPAKVFAVFANLRLGRLGRDGEDGDSIVLTERVDSKGRNYKTAEVHFRHLFSRGKNGPENRAVYEHLSADRDNFIEVEHMPEKTLEDGTVLPRRTWRPRLDRPRKPRTQADNAPRNIGFGKVDRTARPAMLESGGDWDGPHAAGVTEDEAREAVQAAATAQASGEAEDGAESDGGEATGVTDEEYAASVLAGASA